MVANASRPQTTRASPALSMRMFIWNDEIYLPKFIPQSFHKYAGESVK